MAVNSCTAALHLAVEALGLKPGQAVLVPTMTFAATAEIVRYQGAVPLLVDCDPLTLNMDLDDAQRKLDQLLAGALPLDRGLKSVGIIPVHVGGLMMDMDAVRCVCPTAWTVGGGGRRARLSGRLPLGSGQALAAVRREHGGRLLFLLLRQQDDYHGRGRHGSHR